MLQATAKLSSWGFPSLSSWKFPLSHICVKPTIFSFPRFPFISFLHSLMKHYLQVTSWVWSKSFETLMSGNVLIPPSYPVCLKIESKVENTSLRSLKAFFHFSSCILSVVLPCLCFSTVLLRNFCCHFYSSRWICNLFISFPFSESFFLSHILCNVTPVSFSVGPLVYTVLSA